jgi:hypothetical protein
VGAFALACAFAFAFTAAAFPRALRAVRWCMAQGGQPLTLLSDLPWRLLLPWHFGVVVAFARLLNLPSPSLSYTSTDL